MPPLSKLRLLAGWIKEIFWIFVVLISAPLGAIWRFGRRAGRRPTPVVIATDVLAHPLVYARLRAALVRNGYTVFLSRCASPFLSLNDHARTLARRLEAWQLREAILIGHGMGSLCALALPDQARRRIRHLVSLGAPFHGSRVFLPLGLLPAFRDMSVGSEYLLLNRVNALLFPVITPFAAWRNEWIQPPNLAHFGQARDLILDQVGHYNLVYGGEVVRTIVEVLNQAVGEPPPVVRPSASKEETIKDRGAGRAAPVPPAKRGTRSPRGRAKKKSKSGGRR